MKKRDAPIAKVISFLVGVFLGTIAFIVWHFVSKFW